MKNTVTLIALSASLIGAGLAFAAETAAPAASTSSAAAVQVTTVAEPTPIAPTATMVEAPAAPVVELEKQPTTVIEATPLSTSRAEQLRKAREASEIETEQKIVERLEQSRIEAERRRQEEILKSIQEQAQPAPQAPLEVTPVVAAPVEPQPAPQQVAAPVTPAPTIDEVRNAVREELSASNETKKPKSGSYVSANVGMIDYSSVDIETIGAAGFAFGKTYDDRLAVEFTLGAARAYVQETSFLYKELEQFTAGAGARFFILPGNIRPSVGFGVTYVNRSYSEFRDLGGYAYPGSELKSWALDYGISAGLDFAATENLMFGVEYRYSANLTYEYDKEVFNTPAYRQSYGSWTPLEERDSEFWGFNVKFLF